MRAWKQNTEPEQSLEVQHCTTQQGVRALVAPSHSQHRTNDEDKRREQHKPPGHSHIKQQVLGVVAGGLGAVQLVTAASDGVIQQDVPGGARPVRHHQAINTLQVYFSQYQSSPAVVVFVIQQKHWALDDRDDDYPCSSQLRNFP